MKKEAECAMAVAVVFLEDQVGEWCSRPSSRRIGAGQQELAWWASS